MSDLDHLDLESNHKTPTMQQQTQHKPSTDPSKRRAACESCRKLPPSSIKQIQYRPIALRTKRSPAVVNVLTLGDQQAPKNSNARAQDPSVAAACVRGRYAFTRCRKLWDGLGSG